MKALGLLAVVTFLSGVAGAHAGQTISGPAFVVDGDTLEINGHHYRLFGIDAPESGQVIALGTGGRDLLGRGAALMLRSIVRHTMVRCERAAHDDGRGVPLVTCTSGGTDLGTEMVSAGMALATRAYVSPYAKLEARARRERRGFWRDAIEPPWKFRRQRVQAVLASAPRGCVFKAKQGSDDERTYFPPWSPWYDQIKIDPTKGDRWLCSETEAFAGGWKEPRWLMMSVISEVYNP